jgi:HSP20 family protein
MQSESCQPCGPAAAVAKSPETEGSTFTPNVDIVRGPDEVLIYADLPGAKPESLDVSFDRGVLQLFARVDRREPAGRAVREEYAVGDYRRSFTLSEEYDGSKTSAEFHEGVLCLRIPKAAAARAQRVQIRAGRG